MEEKEIGEQSKEIPTLMEKGLYKAAMAGDTRIFISEMSIAKYANSSDFFGQTTPEKNNIIHVAAEYDQHMFIEKTLSFFPELISRKNTNKDTPLHIAARKGHQKTVDLLISWSGCATQEAEEDWLWMAKNFQGHTPLHLALHRNRLNVVMSLLKVGSNKVLSVVNESRQTPLHVFLRCCLGTHASAKELLEEGVLNLQKLYMGEGGDDEIQRVILPQLMKYEAAMCMRDVKGLTPLLIAAEQGCLPVVLIIVSHCPQSAEIPDFKGRTVLHYLSNNINRVHAFPSTVYKDLKELLNFPEINAVKDREDSDGNTPLHAALQAKAFILVRVLAECSADFTINNNFGVSAFDIIKSLPDFSIKIEELRTIERIESKIMDNELLEASMKGEVSVFEKRRSRDDDNFGSSDINYDDDYFQSLSHQGKSILHIAIMFGHLNFAEVAIQRFPTLVLTNDNNGETFLHFAARLKCNDLVAITSLLQLTKDVINKLEEEAGHHFLHALPWRQRNSKGNIPLHEALSSSNYHIAFAFMQIDPTLSSFQNNAGETPLHILARHGVYTTKDKVGDLVKMLMGQNNNGCAYTRDTDGFTPLLRASYCGRLRVACHIIMICSTSTHCRDPRGRTFLHNLRLVANVEVDVTNDFSHIYASLQALPTFDALRSTQDFDGNTPLHAALKDDNFGAAKFHLLCIIAQTRKELTIINNEGHTVLHLLAALDDDIPQVKELKELAMVAERNLKEEILGMRMMEAEVYKAAVNGSMDLFDNGHETARAEEGSSDQVVMIDCKFLTRAPDGSNILHIAIQHSREDFVEEAIKRYPDLIFEQDCNGDTPLHIAAKYYMADFTKLLGNLSDHCINVFQQGCREPFIPPWRVKNSKGNTPLHEAMESLLSLSTTQESLLRFDPLVILYVNDAGETPLHVFARRAFYPTDTNQVTTVEVLLSLDKTSVYVRDREGLTPLLRAAKTGRLLVAQTILKHCPQSIQLRDLGGRSFVHLLRFTGHEFFEDADDNFAFRVMSSTCFKIPELDFLRGSEDFDGNTPLSLAIKEGDSFRAKLLARRFMETQKDETLAQVRVCDNQGQSFFDLLKTHEDAPDEVIQLLNKKFKLNFSWIRSSYGISRTQIKETANTLSVVAALLATLTFAAAFQIPGGYDGEGFPVFLKEAAFQAFMVSNTCAMCGSMTILISLLWVMSTGKLADSFALLDLSISLLLLSFYATLVAFMTGVYVAISHKALWLAIFVIILCSTVLVLTRKSFVLHITRFIRLTCK